MVHCFFFNEVVKTRESCQPDLAPEQFCQSMRNVESTSSCRTQTLISSQVGYTHRANDILTDTKTSLGVAYIP